MNKSLYMNYYFFWNNYYTKYTLSKLEKKLLLAELKRRIKILS